MMGYVYLRLQGGSTVKFRYYLLGGDTAAPSGLYARLCHAFLVFNDRLSSPRSSDTNGAIFTKISGLVDMCKGLFTSLSFF